ncbi:MAG: hypothetical protein R3C16_06275 [Hyphomonadaceae bacterium]
MARLTCRGFPPRATARDACAPAVVEETSADDPTGGPDGEAPAPEEINE